MRGWVAAAAAAAAAAALVIILPHCRVRIHSVVSSRIKLAQPQVTTTLPPPLHQRLVVGVGDGQEGA